MFNCIPRDLSRISRLIFVKFVFVMRREMLLVEVPLWCFIFVIADGFGEGTAGFGSQLQQGEGEVEHEPSGQHGDPSYISAGYTGLGY